nr:GntR family transcriptional regulator [Dactylosporangium thailandense]
MRTFDNNFLPSDQDLAARYSTSRTVIRQVLNQLRNERVVERRQGVGTFVATTQLRYSLSPADESDDQYLSPNLGLTRLHVVSSETMTAPPTVCSVLDAPAGAECVCVEYAIYVSGEITTAGTSYLLGPLATSVRPGLYAGGLRAHLRQMGIEYRGFEVHIQAIKADAATAEALDVPEGDALLYIRRVGHDRDGRATQLSFTRHRSERASFTFRSGTLLAGNS